MDLLNRTIEDRSVIQLCRGARINPRRIYFASDFKKKPKKAEGTHDVKATQATQAAQTTQATQAGQAEE